jgi:hypothetical protein
MKPLPLAILVILVWTVLVIVDNWPRGNRKTACAGRNRTGGFLEPASPADGRAATLPPGTMNIHIIWG